MKNSIVYFFIIFFFYSCNNELLQQEKNSRDLAQTELPQITSSPITTPAPIANLLITDPLSSGTYQGTIWDSANSLLRLNASTSPCNIASSNCTLDPSWTPQWDHLVSYYQLDESSWNGTPGEVRDSVGAHHGTGLSGATTNTNSMIGTRSGYFSMTSSKVEVLNPSTFPFGKTPRTTSVWFYPQNNNTRTLFFWGTSVTTQGNGIIIFPDRIRYYGWNADCDAFFNMPINQWIHTAVTFDGFDQKVYINGVLHAWCNFNWNTVDSGLFTIGSHPIAGSDFIGYIDDLAVWNKDLTADEINTIYSRQSAKYVGTYTSPIFNAEKSQTTWLGLNWKTTKPFGKELLGTSNFSRGALAMDGETTTHYPQITNTSLTDQLKVLWHMNDQSMLTTNRLVFDASGNNNQGIGGFLGTSFNTPGKLASAIFFNGTGRIEGPNISSQITGSYSYGLWLNALPTAVSGKFFQVSNGANLINLDDTNGFSCAANTTGSTNQISYATPIVRNQWYHLLCVIDNANKMQYFYVNGTLVNSQSMSVSIPWPNSSIKLGTSFLGRLDEFAVWGRPLSAAEALDIYRRGSNQIQYQVRTCSTPTCSEDPPWLGTNTTYPRFFSELQNNDNIYKLGDPKGIVLPTPPSLLFKLFPELNLPSNQYFQYKSTITSYDNSTNCDYGSGPTFCSPELQSVQMTASPPPP